MGPPSCMPSQCAVWDAHTCGELRRLKHHPHRAFGSQLCATQMISPSVRREHPGYPRSWDHPKCSLWDPTADTLKQDSHCRATCLAGPHPHRRDGADPRSWWEGNTGRHLSQPMSEATTLATLLFVRPWCPLEQQISHCGPSATSVRWQVTPPAKM